MTRRDLPDLTQSSDAPWPVARHQLHRTHVRWRETCNWWHVTEEAKLACDESPEAGTAEWFQGKNEDSYLKKKHTSIGHKCGAVASWCNRCRSEVQCSPATWRPAAQSETTGPASSYTSSFMGCVEDPHTEPHMLSVCDFYNAVQPGWGLSHISTCHWRCNI